METKKVLIINFENHNRAGGIETYLRKLMQILKELNYEVHEYSLCENLQPEVCEKLDFVHQVDVKRKIYVQTEDVLKTIPWWKVFPMAIGDLRALVAQRDQLKEIAHNYDLIIDNTYVFTFLNDANHDKILWIQHNDFLFLKKIGQPFRAILKKFLKLKYPYLDIKRKVVYSEASMKLYKEIFPQKYFDNSVFYSVFLACPTYQYESIDVEKKREGPVLFMGRLDDIKQKRTDLVDKIAKHLNRPIYAYGSYSQKLTKKYKNLSYKGRYSAATDLPNIFAKASLTLITSEFEGVPFLALESIHHSTPIALRNTFAEANHLLKNKNGLLLDKKASPKVMAEQIKNFLNEKENYHQAVEKTQAIQKLYTNEMFVEKWKEIIKKIESE